MTRKVKTNEVQFRLPETAERTISFESGIDFDWGVDIGKVTPAWGEDTNRGRQETDKSIIKAFVRQISFSGAIYSYIIQIPSDSKLWRKFSKKREAGKTRHKALIAVVK